MQGENGGRGALPVVVGRSLPRAIAAARSAGRTPPFETPTTTCEGKGNGPSQNANAEHADTDRVAFDDMLAGHPRRALEEIEMKSRLEAVKGEVEVVLKMHGSMAKGERESWLKQIERRNEERAYQVRLWVMEDTRLKYPRSILRSLHLTPEKLKKC